MSRRPGGPVLLVMIMAVTVAGCGGGPATFDFDDPENWTRVDDVWTSGP